MTFWKRGYTSGGHRTHDEWGKNGRHTEFATATRWYYLSEIKEENGCVTSVALLFAASFMRSFFVSLCDERSLFFKSENMSDGVIPVFRRWNAFPIKERRWSESTKVNWTSSLDFWTRELQGSRHVAGFAALQCRVHKYRKWSLLQRAKD